MLKRDDLTYYESSANDGEILSIDLNKDLFYFGIGVLINNAAEISTNETIFKFQAKYYEIHDSDLVGMKVKDLEFEKCQIEKFGEKFRDQFKDKVGHFICLKDINLSLFGHKALNSYSFIVVDVFPCTNNTVKDSSKASKCQPLDNIKKIISSSYVNIIMEDIDLTPQEYNSPIAQTKREEYTALLSTTLVSNLDIYYQLINIETDQDLIGLEFTPNIRNERFLKFEKTAPAYTAEKEENFGKNDITGICQIRFNLSEKMLTQKRTYKKFLDILGDIGGVMEIIFSFFKLISSIMTDTLYETSIVNHLFSFNLNKQIIVLKENKKKKDDSYKGNKLKINDIAKNYNIVTKNVRRNLNKNNNIHKDRKKVILTKNKGIDKSNAQSISHLDSSKNTFNLKKNSYITSSRNDNFFQNHYWESKRENVIDKIRLNKLCLYFCCFYVRKQKNVQNILIDEGMELIKYNLDILHYFVDFPI